MKKIRYYYSSMSKQVFLILLMLLVAARFFIFQLVIKYDILGNVSVYGLCAHMYFPSYWIQAFLYGV